MKPGTILDIIGIAFIILKLMGYITWSWWWVTAPFWGGVALSAVIIVLALFFAAAAKLLTRYG